MLLAALVSLGCGKSSKDVEVNGVSVAQASGVYVPEEAPTVTMTRKQRADEIELPEGPAVRLAIGRDVSYGQAKQLIDRTEAAGKKAILLVGDRNTLAAIKLNDEITDPRKAIRLVATPDGKACVGPPDNKQTRCAEQVYSDHVSKASVREFIREAIKVYGMTEVRVFARPSVEWADVIRAVDGARTCCDGKMFPKVRLVDIEEIDPEGPAKASATTSAKPQGSAMGVPRAAPDAADDQGENP